MDWWTLYRRAAYLVSTEAVLVDTRTPGTGSWCPLISTGTHYVLNSVAQCPRNGDPWTLRAFFSMAAAAAGRFIHDKRRGCIKRL
ncbi:hypothetical protein [Salibacterium halotolerans]|uniref:hypothetical protein n=1 Tax=Salibacterium halotolerans TaxID=1884432 RepID=UPI0011133E37|nr:hypothetical protein [Salibacterium halotolerans]